jgi:predicted O-linked N-acetylglucosamine transferase (SPINDLY family)
MDYRLTDRFLDPDDASAEYVERSIRLNSYWCYQPMGAQTEVGPLPAMSKGVVTFSCLNNFAKASDLALATWKTLLDVLPGSRMLLAAPTGSWRQRIAKRLGEERTEFVSYSGFDAYLANYHRIDIALDPFPYCGGTTTCDALWMGVPVVTLHGENAVGRGGSSLLNQIGTPELIAATTDEYLRIARELAGDLTRLAELRRTLRTRMQASPLMDGARCSRDLEAGYREMWRRWCAGTFR